ncbi:MAG: insulinase family protein [Chitinophagales bacterium]|nr:insulinase family protein [Chitinophagaceae bacterium]MCB9064454.1 insulinase family protein [Chitinophagales bacterium]
MKKLIVFILTIALTAPAFAQLDRSKRPEPGPAPEISLGKTESFVLPNGLKVFVVENHKLPMVTFSIQLDVEGILEGDMAGYTTFLSELMTAGTKNRSKDELNKEIDYIGARLSASATGMFGRGLKKHQEKLLDLMSDIAMNADFKADEMEKVRKRTLSGLKASENEPDEMLSNVAAALNFGKDHPYGEVMTEETVNNITLDKCKEHYNTYYRPNIAYMAIVGDVTMKEIKPLIEKYFGKWQKGDVPKQNFPAVKAPTTTNVAFVPRDGSVQSVINVTYPIDLPDGHPDVIKAKVANAILGGGSTGRLFLNLRETHAWTYGSYSSISQDMIKGRFTAYAKCRNEVSDSSVAEILKEMKRMRNEKVTQEDLDRQISYMSGGFAIGLENAQTVAQYAINIERYNMPKDYYQNYLKNLSAVTVDDVQAIAKKYIDPSKANIVVVGSLDEVAETLAKFDADGKIDYYDNYGNKIQPEKKSAAPEGMTAEQVMKSYIKAIGGAEKLKSIKDLKVVMMGKMDAGGQELELEIVEMQKVPFKYKQTLGIPAMGMIAQKQVFDGTKGYMEAQGQKIPLEEDKMNEIKAQADICVELHPEQYGIKKTLTGMEKVNGEEAYVLDVVDAGGNKGNEYYSTQTGYLLKKTTTQETPQGAVTTTTEYADYKEVPGTGYWLAHSVTLTAGPQVIPAKVQSAAINQGIDNSEFE